ncbi:thermonuclease family protein [uncultured Enterovirga sp.]|uniref:thermonuclease family protein n=1 Tax=uncultured Enterovirga sp. TaxID=2026352 RepID=UPI0035CC4114
MPAGKRLARALMTAGCIAAGAAVVAEPSEKERAGINRPEAAQQLPPLRVEVLDGRRFRDIESGTVYRLHGVDTCAPGQVARLGRQPWPCGTVATAWLVAATLNRWLSCATVREEAGEQLARCASASHPDLAAAMVRDGIAVSLPATGIDPEIRAYAAAEREARKAYRGLWASTFQMPWEFRAGRPDPDRVARQERPR